MKKSQPRSRQSQKTSQSRKGISKEYKALYDGPSAFMRARRPHLFSDTVAVDRPQLDRDRLEYYLETLTSRKQETAFEHFARRLSEKELCPNLLPQTGPTGGGDSKVDTETYPVSNEIAAAWYEGMATTKDAATERWAFAISAKKAWKPKVQADIASLAGTNRGYTTAFFITNQYVKDKDRARTEAELRKKHNLDVRILDRTWILEKIFTNRREQIAIDALQLTPNNVQTKAKGPRDTKRAAELEELEKQLADPKRYSGQPYQFIEECIESSLLARALELPRADVEGRFLRALRAAKEKGTIQQQFRCTYNLAWTLYWWYEDFQSFTKVYGDAEPLALASHESTDLDLLKNLWQLLWSATGQKKLTPQKSKISARTQTLRKAFAHVAQDEGGFAFAARAHLLLMDFVEIQRSGKPVDAVFQSLKTLLTEAQGFINFPVQQFVDVLTELGNLLPADDSFDALFETLIDITNERESRAATGRLLLTRGMQKLDHKQPYEAIRFLGRAQQHLGLNEYRSEFVSASAMCARAYEAAGLLWAARGSMLVAAAHALNEFREDGTLTRQAFATLRRLLWIEVQLGRVPYIFAWLETIGILRNVIELDEKESEAFFDEWHQVDMVLSVLLLKSDFGDLRDLARLPTALERLHLHFSYITVLYLLGYEDRLREEECIPPNESPEAVATLFDDALHQPVSEDVPEFPEFLDQRQVTLRSRVLGCDVRVVAQNTPSSLHCGEALFAALEALLATSLDTTLFPHLGRYTIKLVPDEFLIEPISFVMESDTREVIVRHSTAPITLSSSKAYHDELLKLLLAITFRISMPMDDGTAFTQKMDKELAVGRAMLLTNTAGHLSGILGNHPKVQINEWIKDGDPTLSVRRTETWKSQPVSQVRKPQKIGTGKPPAHIFDLERIKHRDRQVVSLINLRLWDQAGWRGAGFSEHPNPQVPPFLALIFGNADVGKRIFAELRQEVGTEDTANKLRLVVITGINRDHPAWYRLLIAPNDWAIQSRPGDHFVLVSRIHTMNAETPENLRRFLSRYDHDKAFILVPGRLEATNNEPLFHPELGILCRNLIVRPAWEIDENDPDGAAIFADDNLIVPEGVQNAPALRTMARKNHGSRKNPT